MSLVGSEKFLLIAGLYFLFALFCLRFESIWFEPVDHLGAHGIPPETGLLTS